MSLLSIASKMGVTTSALEELTTGSVRVSISGKIGITSSSLQEFIDGGTSLGLASKIGSTSSTLQELRNKIGKEGAIGLTIGLCIKAHQEKRNP